MSESVLWLYIEPKFCDCCRIYGQALPMVAKGLATQIEELHELQKRAFYNRSNSRRLVRRCCQFQDLFLKRYIHHVRDFSVLRDLEEDLDEARDFLRLFSDR